MSKTRNVLDSKRNKYIKVNWKILKQFDNWKWYKSVSLAKNKKSKLYYVHRLILLSFIWENKNKKYVNHKNLIRWDNRLENLEWCTASENTKHMYNMSWFKWSWYWKKWSLNKNAKKIKQIEINWNIIKIWDSIIEATNYFSINSSSCIVNCLKWKTKTSMWYKWEYV